MARAHQVAAVAHLAHSVVVVTVARAGLATVAEDVSAPATVVEEMGRLIR